MATIPWTINTTTTGHDLISYVNHTIAIYWSMSQIGHDLNLYVLIQRNQIYSQHCNQSGVSVLTSIFEVYMLQVKVNRHNYNSYFVIYITWLRQSYYVFTPQLKFYVRIYKISKNRYNAVKLSPHMFIA